MNYDDFFDDNDEEFEIKDDTPIAGQIDIGELFIREEDNVEDEDEMTRDNGIVDGQISLLDKIEKEENMNKDDEKKNLNANKEGNIKANLLNKLAKNSKNLEDDRTALKKITQGKTSIKDKKGENKQEEIKNSTSELRHLVDKFNEEELLEEKMSKATTRKKSKKSEIIPEESFITDEKVIKSKKSSQKKSSNKSDKEKLETELNETLSQGLKTKSKTTKKSSKESISKGNQTEMDLPLMSSKKSSTKKSSKNEKEISLKATGKEEKEITLKSKEDKEKTSKKGNKQKSETTQNSEVKKEKTRRKSEKEEKKELDKFFEEGNEQVYSDIEKMNKSFEEVDVKVGEDVFDTFHTSKKKNKKMPSINMEEKVYYESSGEDIIDGIISKNLDTVLHECMIPYAEHVILDRALPRVEDGLKPVQRRILYSMFELGITPDKPTRKCARIVGDCLGKYHPHGDKAVYDALVRMAQPFSYNEVLVTGKGNFGSVDGDGAAAMRYTEAKLSPLALELLRDLDKNTVRWGLNFDDSLKEPEMLPGRFPNLLVNGSSGIAVGLATNIPPHNLAETIDGVVAYIDNPNITLRSMMKIIKGPDFPTGGYMLEESELKKAYETGRGKIYLRAKIHIEGMNTDKKSIIITELPYQVNKVNLLQKIALLKEDEKYELSGIAEIRDESDRDGMRAVIRLKKDADVNRIYQSLLKNTELQTTFGINMVAIAGGKPKQMSLMDIISYYSEYQREIVYRRSKYDLEQAEERAHILQGLIIAIKNIDEVVRIIKTSKNTAEAKTRLCTKFKLSDRQAQAILDMRLARLTSLEVYKLEEEYKKLEDLIKKLREIVNSKTKQFDVVKRELLAIKKEYKGERKTRTLKDDVELSCKEDTKEEVKAKELIVLKSENQMFKAVSEKQFAGVNKDLQTGCSLGDIYTIKCPTNSIATILGFSSAGNCYKGQVERMGESRLKDKGLQDWVVFQDLPKGEHIVAVFDEEEMNKDGNLMFYTKKGMIKKTPRKEYNLLKKIYQAIKLKDGDELLKVEYEKEESYNLILVSRSGMVLNAKTEDVPIQGRVAGGVKGMMMADDDYCVGIDSCVKDEGDVVVCDELGRVKRVAVKNIDESMRYRKGLKMSNDKLFFAGVVTNKENLCIVDREEDVFVKSASSIPLASRTDKLKPLEKSKKTIIVKSIYLVDEVVNAKKE